METSEKLIQISGWIEVTLSIVLRSGYVLSRAREREKHSKAISNIIQRELQSHWNYASVENIHNSVIHPFILLANKDITQLFAGRHSWVFLMQRSTSSSSILNIKQTDSGVMLDMQDKIAQERKRKTQQLIMCMLPYIKYIFWSRKVYRDNITEMFRGCSAFLVPIRHFTFLFLLLSRSCLVPSLVLVLKQNLHSKIYKHIFNSWH